MNRAPAFQFYPADWLDFKVQRMSYAAQGVYIKLLAFMWKDSKDQCSISDNDNDIARVLGTSAEQWLEWRTEIQRENDSLLVSKKGKLISSRLAFEAEKQRTYRQLQKNKALSRQPRHKLASTELQARDPARHKLGTSLQSSSSSSPLGEEKEERNIKEKEKDARRSGVGSLTRSDLHDLESFASLGENGNGVLRQGAKERTRAPVIPVEGPWPSVQALVDKYNSETPDELPAVLTLSSERIKKARHYLADHPTEDFWAGVFQNCHSQFLRGLRNSNGHANWVANFDWLLSKSKDGTENCVKVHDGGFH